MNWLFFFTLLRINLNTKKLNLSRAYLAIPILIYNFYKFIKSQKNYIEDDTSQMESNKLMYSFFISDLILFIKNGYFDISLYLHHIFCTFSYFISYINGTPKIYTFLSIPEVMILGKFLPQKFRNKFYIFIIFFRLPFWMKLLYETKNMNNKYIKINAYVGGLVMPALDLYWLNAVCYKLIK